MTVVHSNTVSTWATAIPAVAIACAVAVLVHNVHRREPSWIGGVIVAGSAWLVSQARLGAIDWILAAELGVGVALAWPSWLRVRERVLLGWGLTAAAVLFVAAVAVDAGASLGLGALCGLALALAVVLHRRSGKPGRGVQHVESGPGRPPRAATIAALAVLVLLGAWVGANSPTATWFGTVVSHGSRGQPYVALTFDDGPNISATLAIRDILDAHRVKGAFFTVGKALDARPAISRALLADGQLLGNHSYLHDQWRWLDPRYLELGRTQRAFRRDLGVCPAFFRPPHGQHTPFMANVVHARGMQMVTWDVSVGDWATHDAETITRRVLDKVRPGSIIDLHDGLDGNINADRSVLVRALPLILDGLQARGLQPVRLDQLLGIAGYLTRC
jgi:peptidoglycan/xylan/chitin deacetylase (PgdA/CDA1 family)